MKQKHCSACDTDKPLDEFGRDRNKSDGRHSICKKCKSDRRRIARVGTRNLRIARTGEERVVELHVESLPQKKRGLTRQEFAAQNDFSTRTRLAIRMAIKTLRKDEILKDSEFRNECNLGGNSPGWRQIADEEEFLRYQFRLGDRDYFWAVPDTVTWACANVAKARRLDQ